ncbi:MAG: hypothetical protein NT004_10600 [Bacteroidetes bacterium]|nr:hypothetical protein [Bacteroidota bacterium]
MLKDEFNYFLENQHELFEQYPNRYLLIKDKQVIGAFEKEIDAYSEGVKRFELGTFLLQHCLATREAMTQTFHTKRVSFIGI